MTHNHNHKVRHDFAMKNKISCKHRSLFPTQIVPNQNWIQYCCHWKRNHVITRRFRVDALLYAPLKSLFHFHMAEAPLWCMMVAFWHYQFSHGKSTSWCKSSNYMEWTPAIPPGSAVLSWLMWSTCLGKAGTADGEVSWCTWRTGLADAETSAPWGLDLGGSIAAPSWSSQHQGCHMCSTINCSKNFVNQVVQHRPSSMLTRSMIDSLATLRS